MEDQALALVERAEATLCHGDLCYKNQSGVLVSAFREVGDHLRMQSSCLKMRDLVSVMERGLALLSSCKDDFLFQALRHLENREAFREFYCQINGLIHLSLSGGDMEHAADLDRKELIEKFQNLTNVNTAIEIVCAILNGSDPPTIDYNELEVESYIGQGNSGAVFEATWLDRHVAVKFLGRGDDWLSMERPSETLINMKHPNLVSLLGYSFETEREQHILVTEKITSRNLAQLSSRHRTHGRPLFSLEDTIEILLQIATGMEYLHSRNELHKGLKPSNIFVEKNDSRYIVKIGDFGLGATYWASDTMSTGSDISFMAPEVRESSKYTKHADVYSYGVICYQLLTSELPSKMSGRSFVEKLQNCPDDLVDLIANCLSETVKERLIFSEIRNRLELIKSKMELESVEKLIAAEVAYLKRRGVKEDVLKRSGMWDTFVSIHTCVSFALHQSSNKATKEITGSKDIGSVEHQQEKAGKQLTGIELSSSGAAERESYKSEFLALRWKLESATLTAKIHRFQCTIFYEICADVSAWTIENCPNGLPENSPFEQMMICFKRALKLVQQCCVAEWSVQTFLRHHGEQEFRVILEDMRTIVEVMAEQGYEGRETVQFRWESLKIAAEKDKKELLVYADEHLQDPLRERLVQRLTHSNVPHALLMINADDVTWKEHDVLGQGATATVYVGEWRNQPVAVKVLNGIGLTIRGLQRPWQSHPNVLRTFGCAETQEAQFIVMELMRMDLRRFLDQKCDLSLLRAVDIMLQIARGIRHLHKHGVTQGDVKPENILVTFDDEDPSAVNVRVAEVCLGMVMWKQDANSTWLRESRHYMAPELVPGAMYSEKSDVYSFAITCSEILTRRRPFEDEIMGPEVLRTMVIAGKRPDLPETCPEKLKDLINRCWSTDANERPAFEDIEKHLVTVKKQLLVPDISESSSLPTNFVRPAIVPNVELIGPVRGKVELGETLTALLMAGKFPPQYGTFRWTRDASPQTFTLSWKAETQLDKPHKLELSYTIAAADVNKELVLEFLPLSADLKAGELVREAIGIVPPDFRKDFLRTRTATFKLHRWITFHSLRNLINHLTYFWGSVDPRNVRGYIPLEVKSLPEEPLGFMVCIGSHWKKIIFESEETRDAALQTLLYFNQRLKLQHPAGFQRIQLQLD